MTRQQYAGDKMAERRMSVRVKTLGNRIEVGTRISGSEVGEAGTMGWRREQRDNGEFLLLPFQRIKHRDTLSTARVRSEKVKLVANKRKPAETILRVHIYRLVLRFCKLIGVR